MQKLAYIFFLFLFFHSGETNAQFQIGLGVEPSILRNPQKLDYYLINYNQNETFDTYQVRSEMGVLSSSFSIRSFGAQFNSEKNKTFGYSLDIGYRHFQSNSEILYLSSSTKDRDSIVNQLGGITFRTNYHVVRFNNYFDFHWNPSKRVKITNSLGVGVEAIVSSKNKRADWDRGMVNNNHPVLKLIYQPQITEHYEKCSMTIFASFDLFSLTLFENSSPYATPDFRIPFSALSFNGIGVRFLPHFKEKTRDLE